MNSVLVIGGQQKYLRPVFVDQSSWFEYHKGVVLKVDPVADRSDTLVEYVSPHQFSAEPGAILFKAASLVDGKLYLCTQTEVLIYSFPSMNRIAHISHGFFNDLHHVTPTPSGTIAVACSGLEAVFELSEEGRLLHEWHVLGEDLWTCFSRNTDYRKINLKPHRSHPNYIFFLDDEIWVTRFYQKDAISLSNPERRITIGVGSPHDGIVNGDFIYFTTTNGRIVIVHKETLKIEEVFDLNALHDHGGPLGWSRGVFVDDDKMWIGFSRIRPTKLKENVDWVKHTLKWRLRWMLPQFYTRQSKWMKKGLKKELPTRLAYYDLKKKQCLTQMNLEPHGLSAIFSILPEPLLSANTSRAAASVTLNNVQFSNVGGM